MPWTIAYLVKYDGEEQIDDEKAPKHRHEKEIDPHVRGESGHQIVHDIAPRVKCDDLNDSHAGIENRVEVNAAPVWIVAVIDARLPIVAHARVSFAECDLSAVTSSTTLEHTSNKEAAMFLVRDRVLRVIAIVMQGTFE